MPNHPTKMKFSSEELKNNTKIIKKIGVGGFATIF